MGAHKNMNFEDLATMVTHITQTHSKAFHHPLLSPLKTLFRWVQWVVGAVGGGCAGVVDVWSGGCYDYNNESDPDIT